MTFPMSQELSQSWLQQLAAILTMSSSKYNIYFVKQVEPGILFLALSPELCTWLFIFLIISVLFINALDKHMLIKSCR